MYGERIYHRVCVCVHNKLVERSFLFFKKRRLCVCGGFVLDLLLLLLPSQDKSSSVVLSFDNFDFDGWVFMDRPFLFHWKEERAAATDESWLRDCCHFRIGSFHSSDTQRAPHVFSSFFLDFISIPLHATHATLFLSLLLSVSHIYKYQILWKI